jgi:para-nitrobenzyl esterase
MGPNRILASDSKAIVETTAGKVRGYVRNSTFTFKGIPYGAPTGGANRFMPPQKPQPWAGVRTALRYGRTCPWSNFIVENGDNSPKGDEDAFLLYRGNDQAEAGEDCLRVNVWTPEINGSKKRPVMVYMHGGAFRTGSGNEILAYDGENMSRRGDVVVVTHNHRLNAFGYLNLAEWGGEKYASSGNVGMLDLVAVLEWVRDNISNFGGDPGNVMIFGQSGGGGKVSALMAMPAATGLFHRAAVQSGSMLRMGEPEDATKLAAAVLAQLNLSKSQIDQLQTISADRLLAAGDAALVSDPEHTRPPVPPGPNWFSIRWLGWGPMRDGKIFPTHPFDPTAPQISAHVPLLVGTDLNEFVNGCDNPAAASFTKEDLERRLGEVYGDKSQAIIQAYRREYPKADPFDLFSVISVAGMRESAFVQAAQKAALGSAPAYEYLFSWQTPMLDGRPRSFHAAEIAFAFGNADICENLTGGTPEALALGGKMCDAWINFARHGNPNHKGLPNWPAFTPDKCQTMIFDSQCVVKNDPEGEGRRLIAKT